MTSQEPFQHHNSYNIFKKAIVKDNERPVITKQLQVLNKLSSNKFYF